MKVSSGPEMAASLAADPGLVATSQGRIQLGMLGFRATKGSRMFKRIALTLLWVLPPALAHSADVRMGDMTVSLPTPAGYCDIDPTKQSDRKFAQVVEAVRLSGNDMLGMSADCRELEDWRGGRRKLLEHMSQYQTQTSGRAQPFGVAAVKAGCEELRSKGEQINANVVPSVKENIAKAVKDVALHGQSSLGFLDEDPNGCYYGFLQKLKADTGKEVVQLNILFMASIKERMVFFYLLAPYENDSSLSQLLARDKGFVAALKSANGL
jgi:hypothetical protein